MASPAAYLRLFDAYLPSSAAYLCLFDAYLTSSAAYLCLFDAYLASSAAYLCLCLDYLTKYEQKCIFFEMGMSQKSRNIHFSKIKAPAGCFLTKGSFSELTSIELIHFHVNRKR